MPDPAPTDAEKDVLTLFYLENARQARHYEDQRQTVTNAVLIAAALVLAGAAMAPRLGLATALGGLLLAGAGAFGFLASLRSHERSRLHVERLHAVRDEIGRRLPVDVPALYEAARVKHARRYPRLSERTARVHYVWQALHAGVAGAGLLLALGSA
jgi:hypothetical protein